MENVDWVMLGFGVAILAFLWNLHRDMKDLGERISRVEGQLSVLIARSSTPAQ